MVANARPATIADLDAMPDDGNRYELLNGEIVMAAAPSLRHQLTVGELYNRLRAWVRPRRSGAVLLAPFDVVLDERSVVQPDVLYVERTELDKAVSGRYAGVPRLVVEVISPTRPNRDRVEKMFRYAHAGVEEYWLADPEQRELSLLELRDGMFITREPDPDGVLRSTVLAGFVIDPAKLYAEVDEQIP